MNAVRLEPGRVYRTRDLARWTSNPPRLARQLVREGALTRLSRGLFASPTPSRFGPAPPTDTALLRGFLHNSPFVVTGPERWNALGLGTTAVFPSTLVYNTKRSGRFRLGGRSFTLRRVAFPKNPAPEWFVVDLLENAAHVGADAATIVAAVRVALAQRRFDPTRLLTMADRYGTRATRRAIAQAVKDP